MRVRLIFLAFVSLPHLVGCAWGTRATPTVTTSVGTDDTSLGAGDTFEVRVYGEKELTGKYNVERDGTVDFPLIGRVVVDGLEPAQVSDEIEIRLKDSEVLKNPQVSVLVTNYASKRISVIGAVSKPGNFPMASGLTVVEAIGLAGGFTSLADRNATLVTRRHKGKTNRFRVAVESVTEGKTDDFALQAGDIVYIPERLF
jgi:protein involved in polysaccharide export with SLBB domain